MKTINNAQYRMRLLLLLAMFHFPLGLWTLARQECSTFYAYAQGIYVNTKDGKTVSYPAETFSHVSPYIFSFSSTTYTQGAVATLEYEKAADLNTGRANHQTFASGEGLVVAGGFTSYIVPISSAEIWQNGQWKGVGMKNDHDGAFSVTLADGRIMIGGGCSERGGVGGSSMTDIYDPVTQTFSRGPSMSTPRAQCKAIATSRGIYVSGNLGGNDASYDFYDGTSFTSKGNPDGRYRPYLFTDAQGNIYPLSIYDNKGNTIAPKASSSGVVCLYGEKYDPAANKDYYYFYNAYVDYMPLALPADIRSEEYNRTDRNGFLVLAKNASGDYLLTEPCPDQKTTYNHNEFYIPTRHPVSDEQIEWRGGVYVNNDKSEAYIIGTSLVDGKYTLHIISYDYKKYYWTIASASGFEYDLKTASWTLLADGRLACTGGHDGHDIRKDVYFFTLPKAGLKSSSSSKSYGVDVYKTDGTSDRYMESELESITTYETEKFDERITQEIPTEYLSKMSMHMPIYGGSTPPNIEGTFALSPCKSIYSSIENDDIGHVFNDVITRYSAQNATTNKVTFSYQETQSGYATFQTEPTEAIVMGEGNNFTIFVITEGTDNQNIWTKTAEIYSGTMTSEGIRDYFNGMLMVDKRNDPNDKRIEKGDFRIFKDADGLSVPREWLSRSVQSALEGRSLRDEQGGQLLLRSRRSR